MQDSQDQKYQQQSNSYRQANKILADIRPNITGVQKNNQLLDAAEKYMEASLVKKSIELLNNLDYQNLSEKQSIRFHILQAKIYINSDESIKALDELAALQSNGARNTHDYNGLETIDDNINNHYSNNQSNSNSNSNFNSSSQSKTLFNIETIDLGKTAIDKLASNNKYSISQELNLRVKLDQQLQNQPELLKQNNRHIWQRLITQDKKTIDELNNKLLNKINNKLANNSELNSTTNYDHSKIQNEIVDNKLLGWLELAKITKNNKNKADQEYITSLNQWQQKFYNHPANNYISDENHIADSNLTYQNKPSKIAVLLPLTGNLAPAAKAIKNGLLVSYYKDNSLDKPELFFIDTKNNSDQIEQYYQEAVSKKADFIIGPLNKTAVQNISKINHKNIPIVALNYIPDSLIQNNTSNFYQFGLSAEDEAMQAAEKSWQSGWQKTLMIVDDTDWGYRVSNAFKNKFEALNSAVTQVAFIDSKTNYKKMIYNTLGIEDSQKRKNTLQWVTGEKLAFKPRRRQDFDSIFLVTAATQAKQIKPILKFYYADNIPIVATSNILDYQNIGDKIYFKDLEGISFCDIPLIVYNNPEHKQVIKSLQQNWPKNYDKLIRLYALGLDAYDVSNNLTKLARYQQLGLSANTGHLQLANNGKIIRQLPWTKITSKGLKDIDVL